MEMARKSGVDWKGAWVAFALLISFSPPAFSAARKCGPDFDLLTHTSPDIPNEYDVLTEINNSYFNIRDSKSPEFVEAWNKRMNKAMDDVPQVQRTPKRKTGLTHDELDDVMNRLQTNDVTRIGSLCRYNNKPGSSKGWGFCFARAMATHIFALQAGLDKTQIRKVWALGPMKVDNSWWRFHVATALRGADGKWYVLDPLNNSKPVLLESWERSMQARNTLRIKELKEKKAAGLLPADMPPDYYDEGPVMFFSSHAQRLWAYAPDRYNSHFNNEPGIDIFKAKFNGYFTDFLESLRAEAKEMSAQEKKLKEIMEQKLLPAPRHQ